MLEPARSVSALPSPAPEHLARSCRPDLPLQPPTTLNSPIGVPGLGRCYGRGRHRVCDDEARRRAHAQRQQQQTAVEDVRPVGDVDDPVPNEHQLRICRW